MDLGWVTPLAVLLNNDAIMVVITVALVLVFERRPEKVTKIVLAIALAGLLSIALKYTVQIERPCEALQSKVECPAGYSFPSSHALIAFTVMLAFLNKPQFAIYLAYAVFVAFTRIYLGVHSFEDVAGSMALAPFVYYVADIAWEKTGAKRYAFRSEPGQ